MDDRQPVSLARRALSYLICYLVAVQPMLPAVAAQITPITPGTKMDAAGNGVPVVNIATPNGAGISHNQYQQYNVGQEGLILNNATGQLNQTQLGGLIQNNPNLKAGHEAQAIINEVVGANRSQLQGYTEVAGKAANVMVANPYGITCNGCGFINTPNVTLTTGKPQLDASGNLSALEVSKGSVIVEGKGLDGSSADAVSIVARATEINAGIHAKDLSVTVGANRVGADGTVTPIAGEGAAPSVAVDTGALGGMYANRIHLMSSEKGVGVNLGNLVAKQGDIQLDANGKLTLNNSLSSGQLAANGSSVTLGGENKASGQITVNAQQDATLNPGTLVSDANISINAKGNLTASGANLTAGRDIQLGGAAVATDNNVVAKAGNDIRLQAQDRLSNSGQLTAGKTLSITADQLDNRGMLAGNRTGIITRSLQNGKGAAISGAETLTLSSDSLLNQGVLSAPVLSLSSVQTDNSGLIQGSKTLTYSGNRLNNLADGTLSSDNSFALNLPQLSNSGLITSKAGLTMSGDALTNRGEINAASLFASNTQLNNQQGGLLLADNTLSLQNGTLTNDGQIAAAAINADASTLNNSGTLQGKQSLQASGKAIFNGGTLLSDGKLTLSTDRLDNQGLMQGQQLAVTAANWHNSGNALSAGDGVLKAAELDNSGKILGQQGLELKADAVDNSGWLLAQALTLQGDLVNSGLIQGSDALTVTGDTLTNQAAGQMLSGGTLKAQADSLDNRGSMQADALDMRLQSWQNAGSAQATTQLSATLSGALNNSGTLLSQNDFALTSNDIVNSGTLAADRLSITSPRLNNAGLLQGNSTLSLSSADISNTASGQLISGGSLTLAPVQLTNAGLLQVADDFSLTGRDLTNSGRITATNLKADLTGTLHNSGPGVLLAQQQADIQASTLNNSGSMAAQQFNVSGDVLNNQGLLQGDNALDASFRQFSNLSAGQLLSNGNLVLKGVTADNAGVWQGNNVYYQFGSLTNSGTVYGIDSLRAQSDGLLDNRGSMTSGGSASLTAGNLQNSGKVLADNLVLRAISLSNSGLWQGTSALDAQSSGALTQAAGGKMLTGGDLLLNAADLNTAGTLQGENAHISAGRWQNQGSLLGTADVSADVAGELRNSGEILSQGATQVSAQNLNNSGALLADKAMTLSGGALNNSGSVQGETLTITPASVTNQGSLIGLQSLTIGPAPTHGLRLLAVQSQPARELINNAGGQLLTQGTLNISADDITNNGSWQGQQILLNATRLANNGAIHSAGDLTLNLSDALTSAAGSKITANGNAALNALSLTNQGQWIAGNLTLKGTTLTNGGEISGVNGLTAVLGGTLTQQQNGALLSGGKLDLQAAAVSNGGRIQGGDLVVNTGTLTNNGRMQGDNSLLLTTSGRVTNNNSGTLISQSGLTLITPELYNYGLIQGTTNRITASSSATNSGKMLSAGELTLTTPQLVNSGWLQAAQLTLNAANASNSGTLLADQQGTLTGSQLLNQGTAQGAALAVNYGQLNNSGTLLGVNQLNVKASQVTQQAAGKLFSGGNLLLESTGFDQLGQVVALGDATLKLINSFTARNTLAAGNRLTVTSNGAIDNQGTLQGQAMTLSAGGDFTNNGQLTTGSGDSSLSGNRMVMNGAGTLQGGGNVTLSSRSDVTLNGFTGTRGSLTISSPGSIVNAALLYAGQNLYLYANSIRNQRGDMLAGNSLWMQRDAAGNANGEVINTSGTIESQNGDVTIRTGHLLNTREGLSTSEQVTQLTVPSWATGTNVSIPLSWFKSGDYGLYASSSQNHHGHGDDWTTYTGSYAPYPDADVQKIAYQTINVTANANGGAGRISSGKDLVVQADQLDNFSSNMLARNNIALAGNALNNKSWTDGTTTVYQIYRYGVGRTNPPRPSETTHSYTSITSNSIAYTLDGSPVYETTGSGNVYRSVIQAGNNINADFSQDISNTSSDAHVSGAVNTLIAPALTTLNQQSIGAGVQKQSLSTTDTVAVNTPAWRDQVQDALRQINGGGSLENKSPDAESLADIVVTEKNRANLGKAGELNTGSAIAPSILHNYASSTVDTSAYPLPASNNGYFVTSDSKSPYLITINPKLNGLGQLDSSLFGDLNNLLGKQPGSAPQETRQQYTDVNAFLGSSYLLDRLNLKPDGDYRFLGDAAFDTRYVSNAILNQTGNQYLNGIGSDLDQMQYLMDNAAAARQSLGLQFGVSLTASQIASLDHSIVWWESTIINGETVMVPKLYLSSKDVAVSNGSVITAKNVSLTGGAVTNTGSTLLASDGLSLNSQNSISNLNDGLIKASGDLNISAIGDINNVSSVVQGKTVALETLNGSINNITLTNPLNFSMSGNTGAAALKNIQAGSTATLSAEQNLTLSSGKNISLEGSALSAGNDLLMSAWGDIAVNANKMLETSGSLSRVQTDKVSHSGSTINAGGNLAIEAGHDLNVSASDITSAGNASLKAANNLNLNAEQNSVMSQKGNKETHSTDLDRTAISSGGNLSLAAGQDINSQAAAIAAEGNIGLQAGRDINLEAAATTSGDSERGSKKTVINETVRQQGTEIASGENTTLIAGHDITSRASDVTAQQDITLHAGNNVDLGTATESDYYYKEETKTKKGLLSKKTTHTIQEDSATNEKGTLLSGNNVSVSAGNDVLVTGSQVVGDGKVALSAGNNVEITAATNTDSTWRFSETRKSGLMGTGGIGISIGSSKTLHEVKDKGTTQSQSISTVGSTAGDVSITAGKQLQVSGADLVAGGNMALQGDSVAITPGHDVRTRDERFEQRTSGLTLALSGAVAEAVNSAIAAAQSAKQESDGRLAALLATKAVLSGVQANQASQLAQANGDPNNGVGISLSLTTQQSKSQQHQASDTVSGSTINAGKNLSIDATGKGNGISSGDLLIAGSQLKAGGDTSLHAANDITLAAAANTQQTTGKNSSSGGGIGISFGVGSGSAGLSIFASVNGAKGHEKGNGTVWSETTLDSGGDVSVTSGRDTTLSGAQVNGNSVKADIGRDLTITSLQDSDKYDSKQTSFGAGGSFTFGSMTGSGYINASQDKMHSNYDSVLEQSGIYAGKGGFDITVGNHTQLNGAVIASQADADKNRLDTGTLGFTDIHNEADYKTEHQGIGISSGASMGGQFAGTLLAGAGGKGHAEGTTQSAVADGTIVVRDQANQQQNLADLSRDTEHANDSISPIFNKEKEQKRLQTAQMIGEIGAQAVDIAATQGKILATNAGRAELEAKGTKAPSADATPEERAEYDKLLTSTSAYKTTQAQWGTGSAIQQGIQAATAAIQGLAGGNIAQALSGAAAPYLAEIIKQTAPDEASRIMAHAVLGAVVAQASGNSGMAGAAGAATTALIGESLKKSLYGDIPVSQLNEEQKQTLVALGSLAAGLTGGLAGGDSAGSMTGAQAGKNEISNNMAGAGMLSQMLAHETLNSAAMAEAGKGGANEQAALALTNKVKEGLDEACRKSDVCVLLAVMSAQNQSESNDSQKPNIGKDLTEDQKKEAGGSSSGSPDGWGPEDEEKGQHDTKATSVDDLMSSSAKGRETTGRSKLFERTGGADAANKEFDSLNPTEIKEIKSGRVGKLPDGRNVIVREQSSDGRPTLEIQSGKNRIKFRYDE